MAKKDNSTLPWKVELRQAMLRLCPEPIILEAYGGTGEIWSRCYRAVQQGTVIEKDADKASLLAVQRPGWSVYEGEAVQMLSAGAGSHLEANVLDVDPYGDPWPAIAGFLKSDRPRPERMFVVVNDGLRRKLGVGAAGAVATTRGVAGTFGGNLHPVYLQVCRYLMEQFSAEAGYTIRSFHGYYCGAALSMTHYLAILEA